VVFVQKITFFFKYAGLAIYILTTDVESGVGNVPHARKLRSTLEKPRFKGMKCVQRHTCCAKGQMG